MDRPHLPKWTCFDCCSQKFQQAFFTAGAAWSARIIRQRNAFNPAGQRLAIQQPMAPAFSAETKHSLGLPLRRIASIPMGSGGTRAQAMVVCFKNMEADHAEK
jgi:hypothetical protein